MQSGFRELIPADVRREVQRDRLHTGLRPEVHGRRTRPVPRQLPLEVGVEKRRPRELAETSGTQRIKHERSQVLPELVIFGPLPGVKQKDARMHRPSLLNQDAGVLVEQFVIGIERRVAFASRERKCVPSNRRAGLVL